MFDDDRHVFGMYVLCGRVTGHGYIEHQVSIECVKKLFVFRSGHKRWASGVYGVQEGPSSNAGHRIVDNLKRIAIDNIYAGHVIATVFGTDLARIGHRHRVRDRTQLRGRNS